MGGGLFSWSRVPLKGSVKESRRQMLHASNCVLNEEGLRAGGFLEIDGR